eukprot:gb/GECH01008340.1/.p1 GENE.gb/GECH01008340.1/~~gb/GECH01008340.1/.p1  ORF type:complete len:823 (+),score=177.97 gb/GECH01008340.1/:1-2469(+)
MIYSPPRSNVRANKYRVDSQNNIYTITSSIPGSFNVSINEEVYAQVEDGTSALFSTQSEGRILVQEETEYCSGVVKTRFFKRDPSRELEYNLRVINGELLYVMPTAEASFNFDPPVVELDFGNIGLRTETEYTLFFLMNGNNMTTTFTTGPAQLPEPEFIRTFIDNCDMFLKFEPLDGCQYGIEGVQELGDNSRIRLNLNSQGDTPVTALQKCGEKTFKWKYSVPQKFRTNLQSTSLNVNADYSTCKMHLSIQDPKFNPWEQMYVRIGDQHYLPQKSLNTEVPLEVSKFGGDVNTLSTRGCGVSSLRTKPISIPEHAVPKWKEDSDPEVTYQWNSNCQSLRLTLSWSSEHYFGNPHFVYAYINIPGRNEFTQIEYASKGVMHIDILASQVDSTIAYKMDVDKCDQTTRPPGGSNQISISPCGTEPSSSDSNRNSDSDPSSSRSEPNSSSDSKNIDSKSSTDSTTSESSSSEPGMPNDVPRPPAPLPRLAPLFRAISSIFGDPHFKTLDGTPFSFNGIGEYIFAAPQNTEETPDMQAQMRLEPINRGNLRGSVLTAAIIKLDADVVEYNVNGDIFINQAPVDNSNSQGKVNVDQSPLVVEWYTNTEGRTTVEIRAEESDTTESWQTFVFKFIDKENILSFSYSLPDYMYNNSEGLGGYWDGDSNVDFIMSNGTTLCSNPSESQIFEFGVSWHVKNADSYTSLFRYPFDADPNNYSPSMISNISDMNIAEEKKEACQKYKNQGQIPYNQCLFDVEAADDVAMASISSEIGEIEEETIKSQNVIPQNIEGIFASEIAADSAFISWNNLRAKYRVAPYYVYDIRVN